jgi:predicted HNH restriction endonuclease
MRMSSESQKKIEEYKQKMPASYYTVRVLDVENPAAPDEICFDVDSEYMEGGKYSVRHFNLERNPKAARDKKRQYKNLHGFLACEVCGFKFSDKYLEADNFIECHHLMPLNKLEGKTAIRLEDLALLCSNCHRVAHIHLRKHDGRLSVSELKNAILRSDQ